MAIDLFSIGKFTVHGYGLMIALGFVFALFYADWQCKKDKLNDELFFNLAIFVLIFGWLGGKIMFCIVEFKRFIVDPISILGSEGFVVYGGIISGLITIIIYCRIKKLDFLRYIDVMVAAVAINQAFGRIGCFLAGCCYGRETDSWIGVIFPEGCMAPAGVKLIPTQLISAAADLLMFIVLFAIINNRKYKKGIPVSVYLIGYAIGRSVIECFRSDERGAVGALSTSQFISMFTCLLGVLFLIFVLKRKEAEDEMTVGVDEIEKTEETKGEEE